MDRRFAALLIGLVSVSPCFGAEPPAGLDLYGDPLPRHAVARFGTMRFRAGDTDALAFSPDGKILASAGCGARIYLWDAVTGRQIKVLALEGDASWAPGTVAFSPDGRTIASSAGLLGGDGYIRVWDVATGRERWRIEKVAYGVAWSPDGKTIATATGIGNRAVRVWQASDAKPLAEFPWDNGAALDVAISPDGRTLAAAGHEGKTRPGGVYTGIVRLWDLPTGRLRHTLSVPENMVVTVAFAPDGKRLASGSWDSPIRLWDMQSGQKVGEMEGDMPWVSAIAFSPDGEQLAAATMPGTIRLWDPHTRKTIRDIHEPPGDLVTIAFSPDGNTLASGGLRIALWDPESGREKLVHEAHRTTVVPAGVTADGKTVISGGDGMIRWWDVATMRQVRNIEYPDGPPLCLAISPDGKTLASASHGATVRFWRVATGKQLPRVLKHEARVWALAFSPTGSILATAAVQLDEDKTSSVLCCWKLPSGELGVKRTMPWVFHIAFSQAGDKVAACTRERIEILDVATGKQFTHLNVFSFLPVAAFSPDGRLLAASRSLPDNLREVVCFDIRPEGRKTPLELWSARCGRGWGGLGFSPDGKVVASADLDGTIHLLAAHTGKKLAELRGHYGWITKLVFSPDGRRLLSGGEDTMLHLWDVEEAIQAQAGIGDH